MIDKQKILEGLEHCISDEQPCVDCPYEKKCLRDGWIVALQKDVLELLKDEPLPVLNVGKYGIYYGDCPHCRERITKKKTRYCPYCGKAVKWG